MIALALLLALLPQPGVSEYEESPCSNLLARDTSAAGIRAWKMRNLRIREAMQRDRDGDTLELVGRWPFGGAFHVRPSWNVTNDSIIYMSSGSGIRVLKASNARRPQRLGQANCRGMLYGGTENGTGLVSRDTFLYALCGYTCGLEVFSVADPSRPSEVGWFEMNEQPTGIALSDSYAVVVGWDSLLRVINVADPRNMLQVAALLLPDEALGVDVKGSYAFVACGHAGLVSVDISNPLNPQQRGQVAGFTGIWVVCDTTRQLAYVAGGAGGLHIINIANPSSLSRISTLATTPTIDVFKADTFLYLTGSTAYQSNFYVVSVADSAHPRLVGQSLTDGWSYSACALSPFSYAYTCDGWEGLHVISLANPAAPVVDTAMWGADVSDDLAVRDSVVYCTNDWAGLRVLSVFDPSEPLEIGHCDSVNRTPFIRAIAVQDSFAFTMWRDGAGNQYFRSLDISDPRDPTPSGASLTLWEARAIVLRDTLAFVAEDYKFEVYNIAQPRQPVRIGSCDLPGVSRDLVVRGDLAYVTPWLMIVCVSDPTQPWLVSSTTSNSGGGHALLDTLAYCTAPNTLQVYSIADPSAPRLVTSVPTAGLGMDVEISGSVAYVGCYRLEAFDITDPASPVRIAAYETPNGVTKVRHDSAFVYAACAGGGLYIFRSCTTAVAERLGPAQPIVVSLSPNPTVGIITLRCGLGERLSVHDVTGKTVLKLAAGNAGSSSPSRFDLSHLPDGCYFVTFDDRGSIKPQKVIISRRR